MKSFEIINKDIFEECNIQIEEGIIKNIYSIYYHYILAQVGFDIMRLNMQAEKEIVKAFSENYSLFQNIEIGLKCGEKMIFFENSSEAFVVNTKQDEKLIQSIEKFNHCFEFFTSFISLAEFTENNEILKIVREHKNDKIMIENQSIYSQLISSFDLPKEEFNSVFVVEISSNPFDHNLIFISYQCETVILEFEYSNDRMESHQIDTKLFGIENNIIINFASIIKDTLFIFCNDKIHIGQWKNDTFIKKSTINLNILLKLTDHFCQNSQFIFFSYFNGQIGSVDDSLVLKKSETFDQELNYVITAMSSNEEIVLCLTQFAKLLCLSPNDLSLLYDIELNIKYIPNSIEIVSNQASIIGFRNGSISVFNFKLKQITKIHKISNFSIKLKKINYIEKDKIKIGLMIISNMCQFFDPETETLYYIDLFLKSKGKSIECCRICGNFNLLLEQGSKANILSFTKFDKLYFTSFNLGEYQRCISFHNYSPNRIALIILIPGKKNYWLELINVESGVSKRITNKPISLSLVDAKFYVVTLFSSVKRKKVKILCIFGLKFDFSGSVDFLSYDIDTLEDLDESTKEPTLDTVIKCDSKINSMAQLSENLIAISYENVLEIHKITQNNNLEYTSIFEKKFELESTVF